MAETITATELSRRLQLACENVYRDPLDENARAQLRALLINAIDSAEPMPLPTFLCLIRIACCDLRDDPTDPDAQYALLQLLDTTVPTTP